MLPTITLLRKDLREHSLTFILLFIGFLCAVGLSLLSNSTAVFSVSPLEVVRASVTWIIPLIAFIVGNGLIVREYLGRTRLFVEALPVGRRTPFLLKFLLGWLYLSTLAVVCVIIAFIAAQSTDIVDTRYFLLINVKTLSLVLLIWSVVFCLSFCGKLRLALYFILIGLIIFLLNNPSFDPLRLGPFALLDQQLFTFERSVFPWSDIAETIALALVFILIAWLLVSLNEGSVAEMLAKPLSRRDYAGLGIFIVGGLLVLGTVAEKWIQETDVFASGDVVTWNDPPVSVLYVEGHRDTSQALLDELVQVLTALQVELGMAQLPRVQVSLDPTLSPREIDYRGNRSVLVTANFIDSDEFHRSTLRAVVIHQVLQVITNKRAQFEPTHWLLDGLSRWWSEHRVAAPAQDNGIELLARAVHSERNLAADINLMKHWQQIAEQESYPSSEALAYSMVDFLVAEMGEEVVLDLARAWLTKPAGNSSLVSTKYLLRPAANQFAKLTGQKWDRIHREWRYWLQDQRIRPDISEYLNPIPPLVASLRITEGSVSPRLQGEYQLAGNTAIAVDGRCVLRHRSLPAFDVETGVQNADEDSSDCPVNGVAHDIVGFYGVGDRVLVVQEYDTDLFHDPIRLNAQRLTIE